MSAPTKDELVILEKFRQAIRDADIQLSESQQKDMALMAWLRVKDNYLNASDRDMDVSNALEMLSKHLEWRKAEDIDNILAWKPPESYFRIFPVEMIGQCDDGSPVLVVPYGKWDVRTTVEAGEKDQWLRYVDYVAHSTLIKDMAKTNAAREPGVTPVTQAVLIVDFEGYGLRQLTSASNVQTLIEVGNRRKANYPDIWKNVIFFNAPRIFPIFFAILKPIIPARYLLKIKIFSSSDEFNCKKAFREFISEDKLPVALGGTNTNSCKFYSKEYSYARSSQSEPEINDDGQELITTDIPAGQDFILEFDITEKNMVIEWMFRAEAHDIEFCITHNSKYEVVPYKKYDAHLKKQSGSYVCEKPGIYALTFDNKYIQFRGKTLHFIAIVREPDNTQS